MKTYLIIIGQTFQIYENSEDRAVEQAKKMFNLKNARIIVEEIKYDRKSL